MEKLPMCRICLVKNVRMYVVVNRNLHELYEKLTDVPFVTEDSRPILACFVCCTKLKQCCQLLRKCLESEEQFAKMMNEDYEPNLLVNQGCLEVYGGFVMSPIQQIDIVDECQAKSHCITIKQELPTVYEGLDDIIEPKEELQSDELDPGNLHQSWLVEVDIPPQHSESDSEDDVPLMEFKTEVVGEEISKSEREEWETKSATVTTQQKLDTQTTNVEDTITLKRMTKEKPDSKVIRTTQKRTSKPGTYFKEPNKYDQPTQIGEKPESYLYQRSFSHRSNLTEYIRIPSDEKPFKCQACQRCFSKKGDLIKHIRIHTGEKPYRCDVCQRGFSQNSDLLKHIRIHTGEKPYRCEICQHSFNQKSHLTGHIRVHTGEKPYKCDVCHHNFSVKSHLTKHYRIHTGEKPYRCDVCQRGFSHNSDLLKHIIIHTGEKPFTCDVCQRSFSHKCNLTGHVRIHTGEKPYKCEVCQRSFNRKSHLTKHIRIHTGEKPYKCVLCPSSFNQKSILTNHIRIHTGEKPYKCDICDRNFNQKGVLTKHIRTHSGEKSFKCDKHELHFSNT